MRVDSQRAERSVGRNWTKVIAGCLNMYRRWPEPGLAMNKDMLTWKKMKVRKTVVSVNID